MASAYKVGWIDLPSFYMDMEAARDNGRDEYRSTTRDVSRILRRLQFTGAWTWSSWTCGSTAAAA